MSSSRIVKEDSRNREVGSYKFFQLYTNGELASAIRLANERRIAGGRIAEEMQRKYRREGRYFDELLEDARNH